MTERRPTKPHAQWTARPAHSTSHAVILADRERLPWRFFGRLTTAILAGLSTGR